MFNKIKPKSDFTKNVLTLMTGTTIAQAIPIAISPILTRLYTPEDFGVLALFVAIISIFGSIANGRYELAIMLPRKDEDAINILALGFIINILLSLFLLFIVVIFHDNILNLLNNKEISPWLYLVPLSVFLMGIFNLLNYFNNRKKFYKDLAKAKVYKSIGGAMVQLSLGFLKVGVVGLISGQIFSLIISNVKLFFNIKKLNFFNNIKKVKIIFFAKRYIDFPKFSLFSVFFNNLSIYSPIFILSVFFNNTIVGFFSLSQRILTLPMNLIGNSLSQVFFQKISAYRNDINKVQKNIITLIKKLIIIGVFLLGIIGIFGDILFAFIFGENWKIAGEYAQILSPWLYIVFIFSPISIIWIVYEKQKYVLYFDILIFIGRIISLIGGYFFFKNEISVIILYGFISFIFWVFYMVYTLRYFNISIKVFYKELLIGFVWLFCLEYIKFIVEG